jgi:hypothetical protein
MVTELTDFKQITDVQEACLKFGELLGLNTPVAEAVLYAALEDEDYSRNLLLSRRNPSLLAYLLQQYPAPVNQTALPEPAKAPGNLQLITKAAKALVAWGKSGFSTVEEEVFKKRIAVCEQCDQLAEAPDKLVYKISLTRNEDKRTCKACGCVVARKARLSSDTCPLADDNNPGFNRWGEPYE